MFVSVDDGIDVEDYGQDGDDNADYWRHQESFNAEVLVPETVSHEAREPTREAGKARPHARSWPTCLRLHPGTWRRGKGSQVLLVSWWQMFLWLSLTVQYQYIHTGIYLRVYFWDPNQHVQLQAKPLLLSPPSSREHYKSAVPCVYRSSKVHIEWI